MASLQRASPIIGKVCLHHVTGGAQGHVLFEHFDPILTPPICQFFGHTFQGGSALGSELPQREGREGRPALQRVGGRPRGRRREKSVQMFLPRNCPTCPETCAAERWHPWIFGPPRDPQEASAPACPGGEAGHPQDFGHQTSYREIARRAPKRALPRDGGEHGSPLLESPRRREGLRDALPPAVRPERGSRPTETKGRARRTTFVLGDSDAGAAEAGRTPGRPPARGPPGTRLETHRNKGPGEANNFQPGRLTTGQTSEGKGLGGERE